MKDGVLPLSIIDRLFGRPSPAAFAARLIRALREAGDTDDLRFDPSGGRIVRSREGEPAGFIGLGNFYPTDCRLPRSQRAGYLRTCVRMALAHHRELPADFDAARPDLRPRIWARATLEKQRLRGTLGETGGGLLDMPHV